MIRDSGPGAAIWIAALGISGVAVAVPLSPLLRPGVAAVVGGSARVAEAAGSGSGVASAVSGVGVGLGETGTAAAALVAVAAVVGSGVACGVDCSPAETVSPMIVGTDSSGYGVARGLLSRSVQLTAITASRTAMGRRRSHFILQFYQSRSRKCRDIFPSGSACKGQDRSWSLSRALPALAAHISSRSSEYVCVASPANC